MWLDENIQMNQQIDRIARRNLKINSMGANNFRNEIVPNSRYQKSDITIEFCDIELSELSFNLNLDV